VSPSSGSYGIGGQGTIAGREDLARVATLIARLFHVRYTLRGTSYLLHRLGYAPQVPIHRAAERDEAAIAAWKTMTWVRLRG
jgi:transposase